MAALPDLIKGIKTFPDWPHADKIKFFAWYWHTIKHVDRFSPADLRACYDALGLQKPSNINPYISSLEGKKPKQILRDGKGLYLPLQVRAAFDEKYGQRTITVEITRILSELPRQVPDLAERTFLDETLTCFRNGAFRASIVMAWNLAYHHLCDHVLRTKLVEFNASWRGVYQGHHTKKIQAVATMDDFSELLKESQVIEVCNSAGVFNSDVHRILVEKLARRNSAAHPSSISIGQLQAEDFIDDLVKNVVLRLQ